MILRTAWLGLALGLSGAMVACGPPATTPDAGDSGMVGTDVQNNPDSPGNHDGVSPEGGDAGPTTCGTIMIQSLTGMGTAASDGSTHYMLNNDSANASMLTGVQPSMALFGFCAFNSAYEQVFAYTMQHTGALRVSTTNPGTGPNFDTTIMLTNSCVTSVTANTHFLGCNDDDLAYGGDQRRVSSTVISDHTVMAGSIVYITLGGFAPSDAARQHGNYELSVQELTPVADAGACDVLRQTMACSDTSTCVGATPSALTGHCTANGTVAGSQCAVAVGSSTGNCTGANLSCDATIGLCVNNAVAAGMPCDGFNTCAPGATCITAVRGLSTGTCVTDGTAIGGPCTTTDTCTGTGLVCSTPAGTTSSICLISATTTCSVADSSCGGTQDCVATQSGDSTAGMCVASGSIAGSSCSGSACAAGLTCSTTAMDCVHETAAGGACGVLFSECSTGTTCFLSRDGSDVQTATCVAAGGLGGTCGAAGACTMGTCSNPTDPTNGICQIVAASGGQCDFQHACMTGESCVRTNTGGTAYAGTCHANGSVAGAACNRTGTACVAGLTCSSFIPDEGVCQSAAAGGVCNPRSASVSCGTGMACHATALDTGACGSPTMETEPNDSLTTANTATGTGFFTAALPLGDADCYHVTVPTGVTAFFASVNEPSGLCPGVGVTMTLDLYQQQAGVARLLATDSTSGFARCPRLDTTDPYMNFSWLQTYLTTNPGDYYLCVRNTQTTRPQSVPQYTLSLHITP